MIKCLPFLFYPNTVSILTTSDKATSDNTSSSPSTSTGNVYDVVKILDGDDNKWKEIIVRYGADSKFVKRFLRQKHDGWNRVYLVDAAPTLQMLKEAKQAAPKHSAWSSKGFKKFSDSIFAAEMALAKKKFSIKDGFKGDELSYITANSLVICKKCFRNKNRTFDSAVIKICKSNGTNINSHFRNNHSSDSDCDYESDSETPQSHKRTAGTLLSENSGFKLLGKKMKSSFCLEEFHYDVHCFVNDTGMAQRTVENPVFRKMLNSAYLIGKSDGSNAKDVLMGRAMLTTIRKSSISHITSTVKQTMQICRYWFRQKTGKDHPFVSICHDIWDGKCQELLGICITFTYPISYKIFKVSLGLCSTKGKGAETVAAETIRILHKFGIYQTDLYRPVNDTTNSALKAGRLIVGSDKSGSCGMHQCELITKHATGQAVRRHNRVEVDSFPECEALRLKAKKFCSWLINKKSKSRLRAYNEFTSIGGKSKPIKLTVPNDTRVSGVMTMYQNLLRSYCDLTYYLEDECCPNDLKQLALSSDEWQQISEIEAVLRSTKILSFNLQTNFPGAISVAPLMICYAKHCICQTIERNELASIVDVRNHRSRRNSDWSSGDKTFHELPKYKQPLTQCSPIANRLAQRLVNEYDCYFKEIDDDTKIAMMCNPLMAYHGCFLMSEMSGQTQHNFSDMIDTMRSEILAHVIRLKKSQSHTYAASATGPAISLSPCNGNDVDSDDGAY